MKVSNDLLTKYGVSIQSNEYGYRAYSNSAGGRAQLKSECSAEIVQEVYKVWGDTPTVTEPEILPVPAPQPSNQDKLNASLMIEIAKLKAGV